MAKYDVVEFIEGKYALRRRRLFGLLVDYRDRQPIKFFEWRRPGDRYFRDCLGPLSEIRELKAKLTAKPRVVPDE